MDPDFSTSHLATSSSLEARINKKSNHECTCAMQKSSSPMSTVLAEEEACICSKTLAQNFLTHNSHAPDNCRFIPVHKVKL